MKSRMIAVLSLFAFICFFLPFYTVRGSTSDLFVDGNEQYLYTSQDGLPVTNSTSLVQTQDGFLWFGGYAGLTRYDGKTFEQFASEEITNVMDLYAAPDNSLWIASSENGLYHYDQGSFQRLNLCSGDIWPRHVTCLAPADEYLYFGTTGGIGRVNLFTQEVEALDLPALNSKVIRHILCATKNDILFITREGDLFHSSDSSLTHVEQVDLGSDTHRVRSITYNPQVATYYIGTSGRRILYCNEDLSIRKQLKTNELECINEISICENDALWLCASNGVGVYQFQKLRTLSTPLTENVVRLLHDQEGNHWLVSSMQGVLKIWESRLVNITKSASLPNLKVNSMVHLNGRLYVGHDSGLQVYNSDSYEPMDEEVFFFLRNIKVNQLCTDNVGGLWIGSDNHGLWCYKKNHKWVHYSAAKDNLPSDRILCIYNDGGVLLIGTDQGLVSIIDQEVRDFFPSRATMPHPVQCITRYGDTLYLGTQGFGCYVVRDGQIVQKYNRMNGLISNSILKLYTSYKDGGLWILTENGINYLSSDGTLLKIKNLPFKRATDMYLFPNQELWILADKGLYITTENHFIVTTKNRWEQFENIELPFVVTPKSCQCFASNKLYICGTEGFCLVKAWNQNLRTDYTSQLVIDRILCDDEPLYVQGATRAVIPADVKRIQIDTHLLSYDGDNPQLYYYLMGFDEKRTHFHQQDDHSITYTNLNGGNYTFRYGVINQSTGTIGDSVVLPIFKVYRWYERTLVHILLLLMLILIVAFLVRVFTKHLTAQATERMQRHYEREERAKLEAVAYKDYLTGLYNRNYLDVWREKILPDGDRPITFIYVDCNNLKVINDVHGHKQGDRLLKTMASYLATVFKDKNCTPFRMGGDEFMVIACGMGIDEAKRRIKTLQVSCEKEIIEGIPLTFCSGICSLGSSIIDIEEGIRRSDMEMLKEKDAFHHRSGQADNSSQKEGQAPG